MQPGEDPLTAGRGWQRGREHGAPHSLRVGNCCLATPHQPSCLLSPALVHCAALARIPHPTSPVQLPASALPSIGRSAAACLLCPPLGAQHLPAPPPHCRPLPDPVHRRHARPGFPAEARQGAVSAPACHSSTAPRLLLWATSPGSCDAAASPHGCGGKGSCSQGCLPGIPSCCMVLPVHCLIQRPLCMPRQCLTSPCANLLAMVPLEGHSCFDECCHTPERMCKRCRPAQRPAPHLHHLPPHGHRHYNEHDIMMGLAEYRFMVPAYKMAPAARQAPPPGLDYARAQRSSCHARVQTVTLDCPRMPCCARCALQ